MINIIYGPKGTGKTKQIIDQANAAAEKAKGNVIFISDTKMYSVNINFDVKCVYTEEYAINSAEALRAFVCGMAAANYDIEYIFIDGIARITNSDLNELETVFAGIERLNDIKFVMTISAAKEQLPDFIAKYAY